jgi:hypothetical protein
MQHEILKIVENFRKNILLPQLKKFFQDSLDRASHPELLEISKIKHQLSQKDRETVTEALGITRKFLEKIAPATGPAAVPIEALADITEGSRKLVELIGQREDLKYKLVQVIDHIYSVVFISAATQYYSKANPQTKPKLVEVYKFFLTRLSYEVSKIFYFVIANVNVSSETVGSQVMNEKYHRELCSFILRLYQDHKEMRLWIQCDVI